MCFDEYKRLMQPYELLNTELIRLGIKGDGGYVVPKSCVADCNLLISFGVGGDCSFDADYSHLNEKSKIIFYDGTVNSIPRTHLFRENSFEFVKENITEENADRILDIGENYFLKMDIEGGEYSFLALSDPQKSLSRCKCIVAEIHWLKKQANEFKKLLEMFYSVGFRIVHLHGNIFGKHSKQTDMTFRM